ncbi:MAG: type II secretion system secretin GspD [Desulfovibrionales bacterium]
MQIWRTFLLTLSLLFCVLMIQPPLVGHAAEQGEVQTVSMDFDQIDILVFIKFISELTGTNFVVDENVRGNVTVISPAPVSVEEAYKVFLSVLEVYGYTVVPSGEVSKIVPSIDARQKGIDVDLTLDPDLPGVDRIVTQIIPLEYAPANELRRVLAPLVSKQGLLVAYPPNESLILTDYQTNVIRILQIIEQLDKMGADANLKVFYLQYGAAENIVEQVRQLMQRRRTDQATTPFAVVADERMNAVIVLAGREELRQVRELISRLDRPTPQGKGKVQVVKLENARAEDLAEVLQALIQRTSGEQGEVVSQNVNIVADNPTNSIVITADPEEYAVLEPIINNLDAPRKQVFIEAAIMEVSDSQIVSFGVNWNVADQRDDFLAFDQDTVFFGGSNPGGFPDLTSDDTLMPPSGLSLGMLSFPFELNGVDVFNLAALINLAKSDTDFNVISYPQIMTLENEEASIVVADNLPFTTQTDVGAEVDSRFIQSIEYRDVGVTLQVTPQINDQGAVRMEIYQEVSRVVSQVVSSGADDIVAIAPTTRKRTAETTVEIRDGSTIVIAGLLENNKEKTNQGIPGLSDIPALGWLFKSKTNRQDRTNLLVFITPHIILNPTDAEEIYHEKARQLEKLRYRSDGRISGIDQPYIIADPVR